MLGRFGLLVILGLAACGPKRAALQATGAPATVTASARPAGVVVASSMLARRQTADFEAATGVKLHVFGLPGDGVPSPMKGVDEGPVDLSLVAAAVPVVQGVIETYPLEARQRLVPEVWLVGRLRAGGHPFLGMAHPRAHRLDVAVHRRTRPDALAATMHHEIAHVVMREPGFDAETWRSFSEGAYVGRRPETKWATRGRPWLQAGFVSRYGSKNPAEDFATYVELGFARPGQLQAMSDRFASIRQKLAFVTEAYHRIVPGTPLPWADEAP